MLMTYIFVAQYTIIKIINHIYIYIINLKLKFKTIITIQK